MQFLTYVLSIEIALTVTVFCREASRERGSEQRRSGEKSRAAELQLHKQVQRLGRRADGPVGGQQVFQQTEMMAVVNQEALLFAKKKMIV